jgi:hypothetical protein
MSAEATRRLHWPHDLHRHQPCRVSGDSLDHSWRRIELKLSVRCSMRSPPLATERVMADFPCASTKRTSHWPAPMSREAPVRFRVSVVVAALVLTGCNANQAINPSSQPPSQIFAGRYVDYNPYDPISYAQNNTGRGGGGSSGR